MTKKISPSYAYYHKDWNKQNLTNTKNSAKLRAIAQGILAFTCVVGGRYFWDKNNPIAFLLCWGLLRGSMDLHTKALSEYLNAKHHLKQIPQY